jgi:hypothetical protein
MPSSNCLACLRQELRMAKQRLNAVQRLNASLNAPKKRHASVANNFHARSSTEAPLAPLPSTSQADYGPLPAPSEAAFELPAELVLPPAKENGPLPTPSGAYEAAEYPKDLLSLTDWRLRAPSQTGQPVPWGTKRKAGKAKVMRQSEDKQGINSLREWGNEHLRLIVRAASLPARSSSSDGQQMERQAILKEAQRILAVENPSPDEGLILWDVKLIPANPAMQQLCRTTDGWPVYRCLPLDMGEPLPQNNFK